MRDESERLRDILEAIERVEKYAARVSALGLLPAGSDSLLPVPDTDSSVKADSNSYPTQRPMAR